MSIARLTISGKQSKNIGNTVVARRTLWRRRVRRVLYAATLASAAHAQTAQPALSTDPIDVRTGLDIDKQAHEFLDQARKRPDGIVSVTLERYPGHFTMLTARTKPGGAELHQHFNDIFVVLDGEATEVTGGTIENAKETTPGEIRGTRVVGGTDHPMRKGDVIHIAPGTPHQTVVADGKYFLYYVIKVQAPDATPAK